MHCVNKKIKFFYLFFHSSFLAESNTAPSFILGTKKQSSYSKIRILGRWELLKEMKIMILKKPETTQKSN